MILQWKDLVRASLPILNNTLGSEPYWERNCQICKFIVNTDTFSSMAIDETFRINKVHETVTERKLFVLVNEIC